MKNTFGIYPLHPELTVNVSRHNNLFVFAIICGTIFIFQDLYAITPISILGSWVVFQIVVSVARLFIGYRLYECSEANPRWIRVTWWFIVSTALSGLGLGLAAVIAELYGGVEEQLFVFAILIGFTGGAVATLSPLIQACILYVFGMLVPQVLVFFFQFGGTELFNSLALERLMGYMSMLYLIIITRAAVILYQTFYESIFLKNELAAAKEVAESANQAKSKFLSSVSHELRTPLHAIMGSTQLLELEGQTAEQKTQYLGLIKQSGNHLLTLIDQILEYAKIEAGKLKLDISTISLSGLLGECRQMMESMAKKHAITLDMEAPARDYVFRTDSLRLKQVLLNLISNAIKYNRPGGSVSVSVRERGEGRVEISVEDTGYGIPEDKHSGLFESFNRLGRESGEQEGTGIGLVICKDLVELMGGDIHFKSVENQGSRFWITLDTRFFDDGRQRPL